MFEDQSTFIALFSKNGFVEARFFQARDWPSAAQAAASLCEQQDDTLIAVSGAVSDAISRGERDLALIVPEFEYQIVGGASLEW